MATAYERKLAKATEAVRDEVGSQLCRWRTENDGTETRVCRAIKDAPCLCRETAKAVIDAI